MKFYRLLIPTFLSCCCNACANMFWKMQFNKKPFAAHSIWDIIQTLFTPKIFIGICFYVISMLLFFYLLSNFKLSVIIPVTCITYILNIAVAYFVFKEPLTTWQIVGTSVIMLGLIIISQSPVTK